MPLADAEREVCGFTHGDIGAWLGDKWNLPESMCEVIRYHHTPFHDGPKPSVAAVVHLADVIAMKKNFNPTSIMGYEGPLDNTVLRILGMTEHKLLKVESRVDEVVDSGEEMWV
jgi:HD-like signal output (HDOD) protein